MAEAPEQPTKISGGIGGWTPLSVERLQEVLPAYEVIEMLGAGGMGAVYRALQRSLKRVVAIKILPLGMADDEFKFVERFRNEAETLARMNHPAIVNVYDFGETPDGLLYFVMEYVDGTDLHKLIEASGRLTDEHALAITAHVCDALDYAHRRGVIHRDIKPANILIDREGHVKVADFGLAKMHDPSRISGLTGTHMRMGTPDYAAPEAFTAGMETDHRADLYAVGVMLYQMLTGQVPRGMFKLPSEKLPGSDPRFDAIIVKAMEANRDERFQDAAELRQALDEIRSTPLARNSGLGAISARSLPPRTALQSAAPARPQRRQWMLAAAIVAALAVLAVGVTLIRKPAREPAPGASASPVRTAAGAVDPAFLMRVAAAPAEDQIAIVKQNLDELNGVPVKLTPTIKDGKVARLVVHGEGAGKVSHLWPLAAFRDLEGLQIYAQGPADISWLSGLKLTLLTLPRGTFTDLSVLKELPLTHLDLLDGPRADYAVLAGKELKRLRLSGSPVGNLAFIAGMPLTDLRVDKSGVTDLSPIRGMRLTEIACDFVAARDADILRSIPTLTRINDLPAAEFWARAEPASQPAWKDWLGPRLATRFKGSNWIVKPDGISTMQPLQGFEVLPKDTRDGGVRVTFAMRGSEGVLIGARQTQDGTGRHLYNAQYTGHNLYIAHRPPDVAATRRLVNEPPPPELQAREEHTLEFRFVGDELTATLDGAHTVTARHGLLTQGLCDVVLTKGAVVKKIEVLAINPPR